MKTFRTVRYLLIAVVISLVMSVAQGEISAEGPSDDVYLNVRGAGPGDGITGSIQEPTSEEAFAGAALTHARNQKRLQQMNGANNAAESMDIDVDGDGVLDVAVIVDNGNIIVPARAPNALDLQPGMRIRYTPTGADSFQVELAEGQSLDPVFGSDLSLGDDAAATVSDSLIRAGPAPISPAEVGPVGAHQQQRRQPDDTANQDQP